MNPSLAAAISVLAELCIEVHNLNIHQQAENVMNGNVSGEETVGIGVEYAPG